MQSYQIILHSKRKNAKKIYGDLISVVCKEDEKVDPIEVEDAVKTWATEERYFLRSITGH